VTKEALAGLSRRERQIMEILYAAGQATAGEVLERLPDPPGYSAARAMLRILENKGHVKHVQEGTKYVYVPTVSRDRARVGAMKNLVTTFFDGSTEKAMAALLDLGRTDLSEDELRRLSRLIDDARKEGR